MRQLTLNGKVVLRRVAPGTVEVQRYNDENDILAKIDTSKPGSTEFRYRALAVKLAEKCVRQYWVTHLRPIPPIKGVRALGESEAFRVEWWCQ